MAFSILECEQDEPGHDLLWLKTCNDARKAVFGSEGCVRRESQDSADVTGQKEPVECQGRVHGQSFENNGHRLVEVEDKKIVLPVSVCFQDDCCRGRCGCFETHTGKDNGHIGQAARKVEGPSSRKDHVDGGSECPCLGEGRELPGPGSCHRKWQWRLFPFRQPDNRIDFIWAVTQTGTPVGNKRNVAGKKGPKP